MFKFKILPEDVSSLPVDGEEDDEDENDEQTHDDRDEEVGIQPDGHDGLDELVVAAGFEVLAVPGAPKVVQSPLAVSVVGQILDAASKTVTVRHLVSKRDNT